MVQDSQRLGASELFRSARWQDYCVPPIRVWLVHHTQPEYPEFRAPALQLGTQTDGKTDGCPHLPHQTTAYLSSNR
ncbi:hypothetical protein D3C76_1139980 [compost metagenome]